MPTLAAWLERRAAPWIPAELQDPLFPGYVRARALLALAAAWALVCVWSLAYQWAWGAPGFALLAAVSLILTACVPIALRLSGSLALAGNLLTAAPFLGMTLANLASGGRAVASVLMLAFVPLIAALTGGRRSAGVWAVVVCAQIAALPWLSSLGLPVWIEPDPLAVGRAIFRAPLLGTLVLLAGIFAYEAVTERAFRSSRIHRRLRQTEERYRQLVETSPDGIASTRFGRIEFANAALARLFGVPSREALRGRRAADFVGPDQWDVLRERTSLREGVILPAHEFQLRRGDGTEFPAEVASATLPGSEGAEFLHVVRDLTRRKQLEEEARQSRKIEAVGQLAGGVAHDFNNMLTVILGEADGLIEDPPASGAARRESLEAIRTAAERSAALTKKLLAFSRQQVLQPRLLDLNLVVSDLLDILRRLVPETISIETELASDLPGLTADPIQLEQVILNLVVNARDAGARQIVLGTERLPQGAGDGPALVLWVRDDGSGMDAATREKAFDPFFTTKPQGTGTGLGLSTVHGIVAQSGGSVALDSESGKGTTIRIVLPCEQVRPAAESGRASDEALAASVLLVEDEPSVRRLARLSLEGAGFRVLEARDGVEALELARRHAGHIDLVVSDLVMPRMGGAELVDRLRALDPDLAVLFMSGYAEVSPERPGGDAYTLLHKPFTRQQLVAEARRLLEPNPTP